MMPWIRFFTSTAIFSWFDKRVECNTLKTLLTLVEALHAAAFFSKQDFIAYGTSFNITDHSNILHMNLLHFMLAYYLMDTTIDDTVRCSNGFFIVQYLGGFDLRIVITTQHQ